ncbi:MAG: APC family permease [Candidatus Pacebacteria bacterium]|nr:APC family permease [Candidatus Paceibacterota bacterium]
MSAPKKHSIVRLGEFASTAIAGNDILSSCLYVSGVAILFAGIYAPLVFLVVGVVLWLYKHVYTEVVEALPLNGGAYNCLLNATQKGVAAVAGVMTVLSYVATSVISAKTASEYLHTVFPQLPVIATTAGIIITFALLVIVGLKDSARIATGIFSLHIFTLVLLVAQGVLRVGNEGLGFLTANFQYTTETFANHSFWQLLFFAFSASLLGVSGFESSANFVEEQQPNVFRKTLRNMLIGVVFFNPLITLIVLHSMPMNSIILAKDFVLAETALNVGGRSMQYLIVADAFLVLSGAVLASFVGASGLLYRMTLDHCFPSTIFLPKLKERNQNTTRLVLSFAVVSLSILFLTKGSLLSLAGVYTISFLGVMTFFAIGNVILRFTRSDLKRTYKGSLIVAVLAAGATTAGIVGNIMIDAQNLVYFLVYFVPTISLVFCMIYRDYILEALVFMTKKRIPWLYGKIYPWFEHVVRPRIVLFAHHPVKLYRALEYIRKNETSRNITVVFCRRQSEHPEVLRDQFEQFIAFFKSAKIFPQFSIDFVVEETMEFSPETVKAFAVRYKIGRNNVFIGSIHESHDFSFEELGGVRIIQ